MEHTNQAEQTEEKLSNAFQAVHLETPAEARAYYASIESFWHAPKPDGYVGFGHVRQTNIAPPAQAFYVPPPPAQAELAQANQAYYAQQAQAQAYEQPLIEDIVYEKDVHRRMTVSMIDDQGYNIKRTMPKITGYREGRVVEGRLAGVENRTYQYRVGKDAQETFANREQSKLKAIEALKSLKSWLKTLTQPEKTKNDDDECEDDEEEEEEEEEYYDNYDETDDTTDDDDNCDNKTCSSKRSSARTTSSKHSRRSMPEENKRKSTLRSNKKANILKIRQAIALLKKEAPYMLR